MHLGDWNECHVALRSCGGARQPEGGRVVGRDLGNGADLAGSPQALVRHAAKAGNSGEVPPWMADCEPVLKQLLLRASRAPGGPELGQGLALLEAAGYATSFEAAERLAMGGPNKAAKRLARAVAANWEPTLVARMIAALPPRLLPFHQLLREFKCARLRSPPDRPRSSVAPQHTASLWMTARPQL